MSWLRFVGFASSSSPEVQRRLKRRMKLSLAMRVTAKGGSGSGVELPNDVLASDSCQWAKSEKSFYGFYI